MLFADTVFRGGGMQQFWKQGEEEIRIHKHEQTANLPGEQEAGEQRTQAVWCHFLLQMSLCHQFYT